MRLLVEYGGEKRKTRTGHDLYWKGVDSEEKFSLYEDTGKGYCVIKIDSIGNISGHSVAKWVSNATRKPKEKFRDYLDNLKTPEVHYVPALSRW